MRRSACAGSCSEPAKPVGYGGGSAVPDWSQSNWQGVTERATLPGPQNFAVRENLGGVQTFANPYGTGQVVELPMTSKYYWTNGQGRFVGTDDPSADPNVGSTGDWRKMERVVK